MSKKLRRTRIKPHAGQTNRIVYIGIGIVVVSLAIVVGIKSRSLKEKDYNYLLKVQSLEKQIAEEKALAEDLEVKRIYVQTKQYIEEIAKEKLGLVNKDEILLKPSK